MKIEETKMVKQIINHQFKILGIDMNFEGIPEDGMVQVGKKKKMWYDVYKFTEEQEEEWREYARQKLESNFLERSNFDYIDLRYGFVLELESKKEGPV